MGILDRLLQNAPGIVAKGIAGKRAGEDRQRAIQDQEAERALQMRRMALSEMLAQPKPLPPNWQRIDNKATGKVSFYDPNTRQTVDEPGLSEGVAPIKPPAPRTALRTDRSGRVIPVNEDTGLDPEGKPVFERLPAGPQPPQTDTFGNALKLRGEFQDLTKNARTIAESYQKVRQAAQDPSAAGDLSLIFGYMRLLDPGSTVREGEFANAQNSGSIPQRIQATYNKALQGERLTQSQREDFLNQAGGVVESQRQIIKRYQDQYTGVAGKYKIDPGMVIDDPFEGMAGRAETPDPERVKAEDAIKRGADPKAVQARYTKKTGKPW